ncbi:MAG: hypothetical protein ABI690_18765 [Chloroflexota bacterium]
MNKYIGPIKWLGGIAVFLFAFALIFDPLTQGLSEDTRKSVLLHAVPFFAAFVGILLLFIMVITLVAKRFNGKIPGRTYQGVEYTMIAGILVGVVCLFQPWSFVPYRYGFLLLLGSTLSFILWSHIMPPRADFDAQVPALTSLQHIAGAIAGVIVIVFVVTSFINLNGPKPPYGLRERVYNSYDDTRKAQVAADANQEFQSVEIPFLIFFGAFPGVVAYFVAREVVGGRRSQVEDRMGQPVAASSGT